MLLPLLQVTLLQLPLLRLPLLRLPFFRLSLLRLPLFPCIVAGVCFVDVIVAYIVAVILFGIVVCNVSGIVAGVCIVEFV